MRIKHSLGPATLSILVISAAAIGIWSGCGGSRNVFAQNSIDDANSLIIIVNVARIQAQLDSAEKNIDAGNNEEAFAHAYTIHSIIFPSIKDLLTESHSKSESQLEGSLVDLSFNIKDGYYSSSALKQEIYTVRGQLNGTLDEAGGTKLLSDPAFASQVSSKLLDDAAKSYQIFLAKSKVANYTNYLSDLVPPGGDADDAWVSASANNPEIDFDNALSAVKVAKIYYADISQQINSDRKAEIDSFFPELETSIESKSDYSSAAHWINGIQRSLSASVYSSAPKAGSGGLSTYVSNIRTLLAKVVAQVKASNYQVADDSAVTAYLDNYEYLEAPLQKYNQTLERAVELQMRENLRQMIRTNESPDSIETLVAHITSEINTADSLLRSDPSYYGPSTSASNSTTLSSPALSQSNLTTANTQALSKGFGTYTGARKEIGQAEDPVKSAVRGNIDEIRDKLANLLVLYQSGDVHDAYLSARSAYLDSYENIEIPLRPIDPDFTLDMEIRFAELRNLIQSHSPYAKVESKTVEIRAGLDESERLVTGPGIVAPAIAFSTSFSIIFREGLEAALILGAILTYLDASRNDRFKKQVYIGVLVALAATAATWFVAQYLIAISGASSSLIEAIAGISAVGVLFWVSFWVLNKVETKRWIEFVKAKVWKATTTGSVMVFVMLSFFTIYREGFETVLFFHAMLSYAKFMEWYVVGGLLAGLAVILGVTFLIRRLGRRLPLRVLFGLTMAVGAYMSIAFIGNAVREFQETDILPTTQLLGTIPRLDINLATMTGIHPTLETVVAQLALLAVYLSGSFYLLILQPRRKRLIESSRKSVSNSKRSGEADN